MKFCLLISVLFLGLNLTAQHQDITFVAEASKSRMLKNSTLEFSLSLRNAQGEELQPPAFADFIVLQGPNRSMGTTIVNGVASSRMSFSWVLQPKRTGTLTIEPATVRASGRTYRSNSKTVEVIPADEELAAGAPDNFLRAELSTDRAYVGQQIIMNLNLYSTVNVNSRNMVREPDLDGFFARVRRRFDASPVNVMENGREYQRRTLASLALFPIKSGTLKIDPYRMIIGVLRFRSTSSFSRRYNEQVPVNSDTLLVRVSELPTPRPADFSGGVGTYRVDLQVDRNELTTDDALILNLQITGQGDIQRIEAPQPVDPKNWDIYDPRVINEEFLDSPSGMFGRKTFQYRLVPKRGGNFSLGPVLTYFNTDSAAYVSEAPTAIAVAVKGGSGTPTYTVDTLTAAEEALVLRPAPSLTPGRSYAGNLAGRPLFWGLFVLPLLLGGGAIAYQRYREHLDNRDPALLLKAGAGKVAVKRLQEAKVFLDRNDARQFYNAIDGAISRYLREKFNLKVAEVDRKNVAEVLAGGGAGATLISKYDALLQRCEIALYAGQDSAADLQDTYQSARDLITLTEQEVK